MSENESKTSETENIKNDIKIAFFLDNNELNIVNHTFLISWNASDNLRKSIKILIDFIKKHTNKTFNCINFNRWLMNEKQHQKKTNDGSRSRIPIIISNMNNDDILKRFNINKNDIKQGIMKLIKYNSIIFIPGIKNNPIKLNDNGLIIIGSDTYIHDNILYLINNINKMINTNIKNIGNTNKIKIYLDKCI